MKFLLLFIVLQQFCFGQLDNDPRYVKKRAERMMAEVDYVAAVSYLKIASKNFLSDEEVRCLLAECYFAQGKWKDSVQAFEEGIVLNKSLLPKLPNYCLALIRSKQLAKASEVAAEQLKIGQSERERANAYFAQGLIAWHSGDAELAEKQYRQALKHLPKSTKTNYRLAVLLLKAGKIEAAIGHFKVAIAENQLHHAAAHNLSKAYLRIPGKEAEAETWRKRYSAILKASKTITDLKRQLQVETKNVKLLRQLADLYFDFKCFEDAAVHYVPVVASVPVEALARYRFAYCQYELGDLHKARIQLELVLRHNPKYAPAQKLLDKIVALFDQKK
jgi:tetratricopeptide (TPR) repeat protein